MKSGGPMKFFRLFSVIVFVTVIIIAHFFAPADYLWWQRTISELAGQNLPHAWIMRTGFILFGGLLSLQVMCLIIKKHTSLVSGLAVIAYGLSMLCTGIWSAAYPG